MEKALYLHENKAVKIIRDGPSVLIREEGKADRRVPARMIQRVVIAGNIKLDTGLLTMFTDNNVPVTMFDKSGNRIAVVLPCRQRLPERCTGQKIFLESEYNIKRYMTFLRAHRHGIQINVLKRLLKQQMPDTYITVGFKEEDYLQAIEKLIPAKSAGFQQIHGIVSALFMEMIIGRLIISSLDPHPGVMHRRRDFGFALDICYALGPEVDIQSIQFLRDKKDCAPHECKVISPEEMKAIAVRFENRKEALVSTTEHIIDGIFELIRELKLSGECSI
ncbi:CRISPR-associated endonuclease Cas1 [Candidatus Kuenenia sp.]|uniref:CRISPR-associated endonuclease Cas1 n=1 Tax=Candidatus Kuenenia sp. TaxID=2499824 RepID=UPI00321FEB58